MWLNVVSSFLKTLGIQENGKVETEGTTQTQVHPHRSSVGIYGKTVLDSGQQARQMGGSCKTHSSSPKSTSTSTNEHLDHGTLLKEPRLFPKLFKNTSDSPC